jgi:hypothetical protein
MAEKKKPEILTDEDLDAVAGGATTFQEAPGGSSASDATTGWTSSGVASTPVHSGDGGFAKTTYYTDRVEARGDLFGPKNPSGKPSQ